MQALKALVIGMGILILIGMGIIGVTIYKRATAPELETTADAVVWEDIDGAASRQVRPSASKLPSAFRAGDVTLPAGAKIEDLAVGDGRIVLQLRLDSGARRLLILDLASGVQLGAVDLNPAP